MMPSWIKIEVILPDKPEVIALAKILKMKDTDTVVGKLIRLWAWADMQTVDGNRVQCTDAFIDRTVYCRGFAAGLRRVGWLEGEDGALIFVNFERHNGETSKERIGTNRRVARHRQKNGGKGGSGNGRNVAPAAKTGRDGNAGSVAFETEGVQKCNGGSVACVTEEPLPEALPNPLPELEGEEVYKEGGGKIPQSVGERPPAPSSPPPGFLPNGVMGEDGRPLPGFLDFVAWVKGMRPGWDAGRLSRREREAAAGAFLSLQRPLNELELIAVKEYLANEPKVASKFDYPADRELFFSLFLEVVQKAVAWYRRTGRKTPAEREEAARKAARLRLKNEEGLARRLARQFDKSPEEVMAEMDALRARHGGKPLSGEEREKIMNGDYES